MKEFCRTVVFGFFLFLFTSVVEANENLFSEEDLKRSNVEVHWQDSLHKILLKYLKGLDAYSVKDYRSAYNIWLPMAKDGFSYAQADIAGLYFNGWGAEQDYETAFTWYQKAAINKNTYAQYMIGNMYWNGYGVPIHRDLAQVWWKLAADKGYRDAQFALPYQYCYLNHPKC